MALSFYVVCQRLQRLTMTTLLRLLVAILSVATLFVAVEAGSNEASKAWLAENAKKDGVHVLPSGLQYRVLRKGSGTDHPTAESPCSCHYEGTLIDGTKFDSSYDRGSPTTFAPNQVIKGWTEAMQLMVEGDKWEMYIPSELGYGDSGSPPKIGGGDALIFKMEILEIQGGKVPAVKCDPTTEDMADCNDKEKAYVEKVKSKFAGADAMTEEKDRIGKISKDLKSGQGDELAAWAKRRMLILEKLIVAARDEL